MAMTNKGARVQIQDSLVRPVRNDHRMHNQRRSEAFFMAFSIVNPKGLSATMSSGIVLTPTASRALPPKSNLNSARVYTAQHD